MNDLSLVSFNTGNNFTAGTPRLTEYCDVRPPFQTNVKALVVFRCRGACRRAPRIRAFRDRRSWRTRRFATPTSRRRSAAACRRVPRPASATPRCRSASSRRARCTASGCNQVDFRLTKAFTLPQGRRLQGMVDLYNLLNGAAVITQNNTYGSAWLRPDADPAGAAGEVRFPARFLSSAAAIEHRVRCPMARSARAHPDRRVC